MRDLRREQKNVRPVREASSQDDFRAIQRADGLAKSNQRTAATYKARSTTTGEVYTKKSDKVVWTHALICKQQDGSEYVLQWSKSLEAVNKAYRQATMNLHMLDPEDRADYEIVVLEVEINASKTAGLEKWDGYPGEGYWDLSTAGDGWSVSIIDLGDPALSMGMFDERFTWTVVDYMGSEVASGSSNILGEAADDAEFAFLMTSDGGIGQVATKTADEHRNDSGFDQSSATDAAFDVISWLEETTPAGSYTYNGHGVPVDMNLDKLVQDWAAATGKGQVSFVALQGLNELLNDDHNRYSKRKTAYSEHMRKYEDWCEEQNLRWDSEASLREYKMTADISSRNWDRLFEEVTKDEAYQFSAAKTAKRRTASMWDDTTTATRHKVAGWDWDDRLSGYVAEGSSLHFACICGANVESPGYTNCVCGKRWNSYPIVAEGSTRLVCREIPVRDVVLARKGTPPAR